MKNRILDYNALNVDVAALLLRMIFGGLFIYNGYLKLSSYDQMLAGFGDIIGIGPKLSLNLVIFAEFFCGIFVTTGFLTRLTVIPICITMSVAFFIAHQKDAFPFKQLPFVYMLLCLVIFVLGSGRFSADRLIFKNRRNGHQ